MLLVIIIYVIQLKDHAFCFHSLHSPDAMTRPDAMTVTLMQCNDHWMLSVEFCLWTNEHFMLLVIIIYVIQLKDHAFFIAYIIWRLSVSFFRHPSTSIVVHCRVFFLQNPLQRTGVSYCFPFQYKMYYFVTLSYLSLFTA